MIHIKTPELNITIEPGKFIEIAELQFGNLIAALFIFANAILWFWGLLSSGGSAEPMDVIFYMAGVVMLVMGVRMVLKIIRGERLQLIKSKGQIEKNGILFESFSNIDAFRFEETLDEGCRGFRLMLILKSGKQIYVDYFHCPIQMLADNLAAIAGVEVAIIPLN